MDLDSGVIAATRVIWCEDADKTVCEQSMGDGKMYTNSQEAGETCPAIQVLLAISKVT